MNRLLEQLPGVAMPVDEVTRTLRHMWDADTGMETNPTDSRASQMNVILHFGLETTPEEAKERFETAIRFAQRYPSRIVVLCPTEVQSGDLEFEGKLFSQCYIGKHLRDLCCCEALLLGYSPEQSDFLESQVSVWLESDLPIYHWLHRVPSTRISQHYLKFLKKCRGILYDGSIDNFDGVEWPIPDRVKDLAMARTLPLRQHMGQFLSGFSEEELVTGLKSMDFQFSKEIEHPAQHLMKWHRTAVQRCFQDPEAFAQVEFNASLFPDENSNDCLRISWKFEDPGNFLILHYNRSLKSGIILGRLASGAFAHPLHVEPLSSEATLSEAMFFC
jgi:hypothetical protein